MRKGDVKVGETYLCGYGRVKSKVEIIQELPGGGWTVKNLKTGKYMRVLSATRLHALQSEPKRVARKGATVAKTPRKATKVARAKAGRDTGARGAPGAKRRGLLDAAVEVLQESDGPMNTKEIVAKVLDKGLWSTQGRTPAATLYSAILREIQKKGDEARFEKVERGRFALRS